MALTFVDQRADLAHRAFGAAPARPGDIIQLSTNRPYAHAEDAYDTQYENEALDLVPGSRVVEILREFGVAEGGKLLEIGCGAGFLSLGMAASGYFGELAITDGSIEFMRLTKRKFDQISTRSEVCLAVLTDTDTDKIGVNYFDVIAMRSVLHHVTDFNAFSDMLLGKLKPGGALLMYEPRAELFLWMGTVMALFLETAGARGIALDDREQNSVQLFIDTMGFYLRRDIDKSAGEDKYAFWQTEMLDIAVRNGSILGFRSEHQATDLVSELIDYCKYCMNFGPDLIAKLTEGLSGLRAVIEGFLQGVQPPDLAGWYIYLKREG